MDSRPTLARGTLVLATCVAVAAAAVFLYGRQPAADGRSDTGRQATHTVARGDFVRAVRLSGTVEAVESTTIAAPRLSGPNSNSLIITKLVRAGSTVSRGDLIVEFDRQDQIKNALDRRAELQDLEQQIAKREAQERAARAHDDSEITLGESAIGRAQLEMVKNEMLPKINAEKNTQALEQAQVTLQQLKATYELKRRAAEADIRILQIRRDRAANAERQAAGNAERMAIHAPIAGMAVVKTIWKGNNMADVQEGEEVRAGVPVVDIVNPRMMRVRARVNQADINDLQVGQPVRIGLDAYPELSFDGRVGQISPLGVTSTLSQKVRTFVVLIAINGSHPNLMPDLSASLDVTLSRVPRAIVVPRDALRPDGDRTFVRVQRGTGFEDRAVTVSALNAHQAMLGSGVDEGAVIARNVLAQAGRR
jgi:HlyD family secretion protein